MQQAEALLAITTAPDLVVARELSRTLVQEGLVACVNVLPGATSIYRWKGEVQEDSELVMLMKTTRAGFAALETRLVELHPYEVPEVIALDITRGSEPYIGWLLAQVRVTPATPPSVGGN